MNFVNRDPSVSKSIAVGLRKASPPKLRGWAIPYRAIAPLAMLCDAFVIVLTSVLSGVAYHYVALGNTGDIEQFAGFAAVVAALFIAVGKSGGFYELAELLDFKSQVWRVATKWIGIFLFLTAVAFAMKMGVKFSRGATLAFAISGLPVLIGVRVFWRMVLADGLKVRNFSGRKIVLIAEQSSAVDSGLFEVLTRHGLQLAHHFVLPAARNAVERRKEIRAVIAQAIRAVRGSSIHEIIVAANLDRWAELEDLVSELRVLPLPVNLVPVGPISELFKLSSHTIGDTVTIELQHGPRTLVQLAVKRIFDVVIAGIGVVLLLPLFVITAIAVKLDSPGPILFRQRRHGFNGRAFQILKFRTMSVQEDGPTIVQCQPNDPRVTRIGHWLRRTSIDELPQLINILRGSMSLVGPRPHAVAHDNQFDKLVSKYAYRHHVKPGLTGWAQVHGYRGETRTVADIEQRIKFDLWYIDNWNLVIDFKIVLMTMVEVIRGADAY